MALIAISGKINSGKDLTGNIIQYLTMYRNAGYTHPITEKDFNDWSKHKHYLDSTWEIKKFADTLKDIVCLLIGCTREQLEDQDFKNKELGEEWWFYRFKNSQNTGKDKLYISLEELNKSEFNSWGDEAIKEYTTLVKPTPRYLLQYIGTDLFRDQLHSNIWINSLFSEYKLLNGIDFIIAGRQMGNSRIPNPLYPNWIITDMRFPNELKAVEDKDGITIRINRPLIQYDRTCLDCNKGFNFEEIKNRVCPYCDSSNFAGVLYERSNHESETALDNANFDYVIDNNSSVEDLIVKVKEILIKENLL